MPTQDDLLGAGVAPLEAGMLGNAPQLLAAAGSTQANAAAILTHLVEMTATGSDGIVLPSAAKIGTPYYVYNSSGSTGLVYVPVNHTLNATANGSLSMATHKAAILIQYKRLFWMSILTA